ncbi:TIGR04283 family arsenosugar biosynthesis glycosyltransferase [Zobellia russellii]|uniref:TIGR04283 family arsenosugar biosynthesis glycosyltransferase n=1 Tax=Zobellia russellii TaxID=248907 RepID=UPI001BFFA99C|nr:TIGR04283 family arsenosugar biosynthesis glycosyltransferase [Zobellia russellii]MBT9188396.1 TIGR04283 family arsenosugar biosynthesis glycosyltransferase [Zobellia russellii]
MISIVIPAHNERQNLSHLLPSLELNSNGIVFEVIVVLSCDSMDGSENLEVSSHISFVRCKDRGRAVQMNIGAALAKGTILAFLHADVKPPKTFLCDIENALRGKYEAGFFSYQFDKKSFLLNINASFTGKDGIFTGGGDQCLFIERSTFDLLGKFNERQILMEDFEFFKRMKKNHIPYTIVNSDLIVSARKYESNSYLRVNLTNLLLVILFKMGLPSHRLKFVHNALLNRDYQHKT